MLSSEKLGYPTDLARSARLWINQRTPVLRAPTMKLAKDIAIATYKYTKMRGDDNKNIWV